MTQLPRTNVLGVGIHALDMPVALATVLDGVDRKGTVGFVTVTGVHGVIESQQDQELLKIHNRSYLSLPDGIPMVWMGRLQGHRNMKQVCGPEFMPAMVEKGLQSQRRHYFWGGGPGVAEKLTQVLLKRHSELKIVGHCTPPFRPLTPEEEELLVSEILEKKPHFFWVGLSTPKQERFMHGFLQRHGHKLQQLEHGILFFGVGAAFDFQAGLVKEAPRWIRGTGLEWAFRLCMDPKRLWKRYVYNNPRFLWWAFLQLMGFRKFPMSV